METVKLLMHLTIYRNNMLLKKPSLDIHKIYKGSLEAKKKPGKPKVFSSFKSQTPF